MNARPAIARLPVPHQNKFLASLSEDILDRIAHRLDLVPLSRGQILYETGHTPRYAYFPSDCIVSLQLMTEAGKGVELGVVGNEGSVGLDALFGGSNPCQQAVVESTGTACRLPVQLLKEEFDRGGELARLVLLYMQSLITQIAQTAVCNRHHSIQQQVCRRLLLSFDRLPSDQIILTQDTLANLLGVRREGITEAAGLLRDLGVIEYRRGRITILDRTRLEMLSCECYGVVKAESDRLLPYPCTRRPLDGAQHPAGGPNPVRPAPGRIVAMPSRRPAVAGDDGHRPSPW